MVFCKYEKLFVAHCCDEKTYSLRVLGGCAECRHSGSYVFMSIDLNLQMST